MSHLVSGLCSLCIYRFACNMFPFVLPSSAPSLRSAAFAAIYRSLYCFCLFCPLHFLPKTLGERLQRTGYQHLAVAVLRISSFDRGFLHHESHFRHTMRVSTLLLRRHDVTRATTTKSGWCRCASTVWDSSTNDDIKALNSLHLSFSLSLYLL